MGRKLPSALSPAPEPANQDTKIYGVGEFIAIVKKYPKGGRLRGAMINQILKAGFVKTMRQGTLREVLRRHEVEGKQFAFDEEWKANGRPALLTDTELDDCAKKIASIHGKKE